MSTNTGIYLILIVLISSFSCTQFDFLSMSASSFTSISRCSLSYCCCLSVFVYGAFILFNFQLKLGYQNLWLISFGLFMFCYFFSLIFTYLIEVPLKVITKNILLFTEEDTDTMTKITVNTKTTLTQKEDSNTILNKMIVN